MPAHKPLRWVGATDSFLPKCRENQARTPVHSVCLMPGALLPLRKITSPAASRAGCWRRQTRVLRVGLLRPLCRTPTPRCGGLGTKPRADVPGLDPGGARGPRISQHWRTGWFLGCRQRSKRAIRRGRRRRTEGLGRTGPKTGRTEDATEQRDPLCWPWDTSYTLGGADTFGGCWALVPRNSQLPSLRWGLGAGTPGSQKGWARVVSTFHRGEHSLHGS